MNEGKTVFSQVMEFLPMYEFRKCVERYRGDYKIQSFTCLDQFLCMAFAQMTFRESLRDIQACLRSKQNKLYHMGIRGQVSRNTLSNANNQRDWHHLFLRLQHEMRLLPKLFFQPTRSRQRDNDRKSGRNNALFAKNRMSQY